MSYDSKVIEVGPDAEEFLAENMAITFAGDAPESLRPYCFLIEQAELVGELAPGQRVIIDDQEWLITAVGRVAAQNLHNLGHVTFVFDGADTARMDGSIHLSGKHEAPALTAGVQLRVGL